MKTIVAASPTDELIYVPCLGDMLGRAEDGEEVSPDELVFDRMKIVAWEIGRSEKTFRSHATPIVYHETFFPVIDVEFYAVIQPDGTLSANDGTGYESVKALERSLKDELRQAYLESKEKPADAMQQAQPEPETTPP